MYYFPNVDERTGVEFICSGIAGHDEPVLYDDFVVYQSVTLDDGSVLRNVKVDSAIAPLFARSIADPNAIYVVKKLLDGWVVYAIEAEGRLNTGKLTSFVRARTVAAAVIAFSILLMPFVSATGGELGFTLMSCVALLSLLSAMHYRGVGSMLRSASDLRNTRSLEIL